MSADSRVRYAVNDNDGVERWQDEAGSYKDRILSELKSLVGDAERLFRSAAETSSDGLASMRANLDRRIERTRDQVDAARRIVTRKAEHSTAVTREYVRENPLRSVGIATAAGVLVGVLVVAYLNHRR